MLRDLGDTSDISGGREPVLTRQEVLGMLEYMDNIKSITRRDVTMIDLHRSASNQIQPVQISTLMQETADTKDKTDTTRLAHL